MNARVLFLDHVGVLGGAELALLDLAGAYRETSAVVLFAAKGLLSDRLAQLGVTVQHLEAATLHDVRRGAAVPNLPALLSVWRLARCVAGLARGYDVIYANTQKSFVVAAIAGVLARRPIIWELHDLLSLEHFSALNIRVGVILGNLFASRIITNSEASAAAFVANGGARHKVWVVHNGISSQEFDRVGPEDIASVRQQLGLRGAPIVAMFGRLSPWKGQHVMLAALARVPEAQLLVVGDAIFGEEGYAGALHRQAEALGVTSRVRFLGFREDIPCLMRLADVVVHASVAPEPFGRVVVEGMLAARPVVASRGGGVPEIIEHGVNGVLVEPGNSDALADAINGVLSAPDQSRRMALAGRARAEAVFSVDSMVSLKSKFIEEVAAGRRGRRARPLTSRRPDHSQRVVAPGADLGGASDAVAIGSLGNPRS